MDITGLILAGGRGSRMGNIDKGLQEFRGRPLVEQVIERLAPQVENMLISANRHLADYAKYGIPVCTDGYRDFSGPLAGLEAGMRRCETDFLVTAPCDSPFLPTNLVEQLASALQGAQADLAIATTTLQGEEQVHPVFCLLKLNLLESLSTYLQTGGRKVREWQSMHKMVAVPFADADAFRNFNTLDQLREFE